MSDRTSLKDKVRVAVPWTLASAIARMLLSLIGTILLVRHLAPEAYGVWALLMGLAGPVFLLVSFGYTHYFTRFLPALEDHAEIASVVWPILARRMVYTGLLASGIIVSFPIYAERLGLEAYHVEVILYQLTLIASVGVLYITLAFNARFMQREVLLLTVPQQALWVVFAAVGIALDRELRFFVILISVLTVLNFVYGVAMLLAHFGAPPARLWAQLPAESGDQRSYRRASYVGDYGATFLNTEVDRYLIAAFGSSTQVAIYAVATTIVERARSILPTQLFRPLMEATFFRRYEETGDVAEIDRMFRLLFVLISVGCFAFVAVFVPVGEALLKVVFREEYVAGYSIVVIYLVTMFSHQMPAGLILKALKRADVLVYAQGAVILNLTLGLYLVSEYGGIGMAIATALSVTVKNGIMYGWAKRLMRVRLPWMGVGKCMLAASAAIAAAEASRSVLAPSEVMVLVLLTPIAGVVYLLALRVLQPFDASETRLLMSVMPPAVRGPLSFVLG